MSHEVTRVIVVDDHPLFREGVVHSLQAEGDFLVVAEGENAADALRLSLEHLPDLLLLDLTMPGGGLNAVAKVSEACPVTKVVMLTVSEEEDDVLAALKAGARAYVLKGVSSRELRSVLHSVQAGEVYVTPTLAAGLLREMTGKRFPPARPSSPLEELTDRERQILELVAEGRSNKEVGRHLDITEKTVKHYMTNILQKLQVRNRVEAALIAQRSSQAR
jgi:two-component system nitrate/nitrite response regulator NarL